MSTAVWEEENLIPLTFCSSGTKTFLAFLIIGCGFSSSWENLCLRGLNSSPPGTLDRTRSVGSGWKLMSTSMASGSIGEGVLRSAESSRGKSKLGYKTGKRQWTRWPDFTPLLWNLLGSYVALSRWSHKDILSLQTFILKKQNKLRVWSLCGNNNHTYIKTIIKSSKRNSLHATLERRL